MDAQDYGMAVEPEGVPAGKIFSAGLIIFGTVTVAVITLFQIYSKGVQTASFEAADLYVAYPAIRDAQVEGMRKITQYEVLDEAEGRYRIPIDRAMELLVNERSTMTIEASSEVATRR